MGMLNVTVVEYFDNTSIENIATALFYYVDKIIYIGPDEDKINLAINRYNELLNDKKKLNIELVPCIEPSNNLQKIVDVLEKIVAENDEVIFDLEGGKELFLVAAGMVYANNKEKVSLHRIDINNNQLINISNNKVLLKSPHTNISVEENVKIYGGEIVEKKDKKRFFSSEWEYNKDLINDILLLWRVYKNHLGDWTEQIKELKYLTSSSKNGLLGFDLNKRDVQESSLYSSKLLSDLSACGAILNFNEDNRNLTFQYKNKNIKDLLSQEGNILETYVTVCAINSVDDKGEKIFNDARTGIVISWDEQLRADVPFVSNEIDVALMRGLVPIFISCKCGMVKAEELYKLNSVAFEFGKKYIKKVLIVASLKFMSDTAYKEFKQRASELDISIIELDETPSLKNAISNL